jgi:transposase InsO family protein
MPWRARETMDVKREFMRRLKSGERMSDLCREYEISRETGYELERRFDVGGDAGLQPQSRAPKHSPKRTPPTVVDLVVEERRAHPTWGARKLKVMLERSGGPMPASSTIHGMLKRRGLVEKRRRLPTVTRGKSGLRQAAQPNEVWCVDYKGQFRLGDKSLCYPLTLTDQYSRFLVAVESMAAIDGEAALETTFHAFRRYGLPDVIRSDNGSPFASSRAIAGLSTLSTAWMRLGIELEHIDPGHPEQNGRHERMHRTLKQDTTRPASSNLLAQQERFNRFVEEFNSVRPHEALDNKTPAAVYRPSAKPFPGAFPDVSYPLHDDVVVIPRNGQLRIGRHQFFLSHALVGHPVGIREEEDGRWLVTFMKLDLGHYAPQTNLFTDRWTELCRRESEKSEERGA